jgi:hypothetical protein
MAVKTTWEPGHDFELAQPHEPVGNGNRNGADTETEGLC